MKKLRAVLTALAVATLFAGCSSLKMIQGDNESPSSENYRVLGRVSITTSDTKSGYNKLMDEAKRMYPDADDIAHILVDAKETRFLWFKGYSYVMSAVVLDYTN